MGSGARRALEGRNGPARRDARGREGEELARGVVTENEPSEQRLLFHRGGRRERHRCGQVVLSLAARPLTGEWRTSGRSIAEMLLPFAFALDVATAGGRGGLRGTEQDGNQDQDGPGTQSEEGNQPRRELGHKSARGKRSNNLLSNRTPRGGGVQEICERFSRSV